jgi:hypothetical protein
MRFTDFIADLLDHPFGFLFCRSFFAAADIRFVRHMLDGILHGMLHSVDI